MQPWLTCVLPSIRNLRLGATEFAKATAATLVIHGIQDRSSPYGGGREWALRLPNARLLTVLGAAHVPWIEAPDLVFGSIDRFLDGRWPDAAEAVTSLDSLRAEVG